MFMSRQYLVGLWAVLWLLAVWTMSASAAGVTCPARFHQEYLEAMSSDQHEEVLEVALWVAGRSTDPEFNSIFRTFAKEVLAVYDAPSVPGVDFQQTLYAFMRSVEGLAAGRYTLAEFKAGFRAADEFRQQGLLLPGIVERVPTTGSSSWISTIFNRGHLFEMSGARYLTRTGPGGGDPLVDLARVKGFGFRVTVGGTALEGDMVELLAAGERWIDLKGAGGNYTVGELARIEQALEQGLVKEFVVGYQQGTTAPADWIAALQATNQRLVAGGYRPILFVDAGPL